MRKLPRAVRPAFTLVELLVVIGIIALLISILLPALSRAKDASQRIKCLANLKSIGLAMIMYTNDNKGYFCGGGRGTQQSHSDFIFWQQPQSTWSTTNATGIQGSNDTIYSITDPRSLDNGALVKYMGGHFNPNSWICPGDTVTVRYKGPPVYPYSYDMNFLLGNNIDQYQDGSVIPYLGGQVIKMVRIKHPSNCIMMLEESSLTIDDGYMSLEGIGSSGNGTQTINGYQVYPGSSGANWLAVWHDRNAHRPDELLQANEIAGGIPNPSSKGNVVFCDGHADYVTRNFAENPGLRHWDPTF